MSLSLLFAAALFVALNPARAELRLASPFTDHVVLQRELPVPVWGWGDAGAQVTVEFAGQKKSGTADSDGAWRVTLDPLAASANPRELVATAINRESKVESRKLQDVLVGEVWLASGQSNMAFTVSKKAAYFAGVVDEENEIAAANYPLVRMFMGQSAKAYAPQRELAGQWQVCSPETVPGWSAVGYLFARELQKDLKIPVGIVTIAFGASCAQAWIRRDVT